jgi:mono/diheme cytochrome c family protein
MLIATVLFFLVCTALFVLRKRLGLFWSGAGFFISTVLYLQHGIDPPAPGALILLYAGTAALAMILYVTSSEAARLSVWNPIKDIMVTPSKHGLMLGLIVSIPGIIAYQTYMGSLPSSDAPPRIRSVHPPPPNTVKFQSPGTAEPTEFNVIKGDSAIRHLETEDPEAFAAHLARGKTVYFENCYYCHGDTLAADGHYATLLNPRPANFQDPGVLPQLQEGFLFWRVTKGGPGMPDAGGPWDSSMPAWEKFLGEEDMWNVIAFLYDYTGFKPRSGANVEGH